MTSSPSLWIPEVDGLRFVAITLVVLFHLSAEVTQKAQAPLHVLHVYAPLLAFLGRGDIGVRIFFVISGFILGRPFARHYLLGDPLPTLRRYYLRRLTRLEPPYIINIAICAISIFLYKHTSPRQLISPFVASAFYLHGLFYHGNYVINPVTWTLELEVQFYLLVPLLSLIYTIRSTSGRRLLLLLFCMTVPAVLVHFVFHRLSPDSFLWATVACWIQYFVAGLLLADIYVLDIPRWTLTWRWDVLSILAWVLLAMPFAHELYTFEPLIMCMAFIGAFRGPALHKLLTLEWLAIIGGMCYSLYLWHFFIISLVFKASRHLIITRDALINVLCQGLIILPCVLIFCTGYFILIERPCMDPDWPNKLSGRLRRLL